MSLVTGLTIPVRKNYDFLRVGFSLSGNDGSGGNSRTNRFFSSFVSYQKANPRFARNEAEGFKFGLCFWLMCNRLVHVSARTNEDKVPRPSCPFFPVAKKDPSFAA